MTESTDSLSRLALVSSIMNDDTDVNPEFLKAQQQLVQTKNFKRYDIQLVGKYGVGKGTLLYYLKNGEFLHSITCSMVALIADDKKLSFHTYKYGDHHTAETLNHSMIRYKVRVVCFSLNDPESFDRIKPLITSNVILIGLKSDLPVKVPQSIIDDTNKGTYFKISTKTGDNTREFLDEVEKLCTPVKTKNQDYSEVRKAIAALLDEPIAAACQSDTVSACRLETNESKQETSEYEMGKSLSVYERKKRYMYEAITKMTQELARMNVELQKITETLQAIDGY